MKIFVFCAIFIVISVQNVTATPRYRVKRVSDAHLADLETRIALGKNVKGVAVTMPVAGGRFDPMKIGRKRRSQTRFLDILFNQSEEDKADDFDASLPETIEYRALLNRLRGLRG